MPKIHIALVGKQTTPISQVIEHVKPDQMILLPSQDSHQYADVVKAQYVGKIACDIYDLSVDDIAAIRSMAVTIAEAIPMNYEVTLDLTSGVKPWALIFIEVFKEKLPQSDVYYVYQNGKLINMSKQEAVGDVDFDYNMQFRLLGHNFSEYTLFTEYTHEDEVATVILKDYYHENSKQFTPLMMDFCKYVSQNKLSHDEDIHFYNMLGDVSWTAASHTMSINIAIKGKVEISSPHAWHLTTTAGWFEYYVANILSKIFPPDQIFMNCHFKGSNNNDLNEVDIIVNTGKKLLFVECKTQIKDSNDVDKFASVVRNYGALGSKALFITYWRMLPNGVEKCKNNRISGYNMHKRNESSHIENLKILLNQIINKSNL